MSRRIYVLNGHPAKSSFCDALFDAYVKGATDAGAEVHKAKLRDMRFDPILHEGYKEFQNWEPALSQAVDQIGECDHFALVFPMWWGQMPALLKGFIDRTFLPGVAFQYRKDNPMWDKLYEGRSADALITMDTPAWYLWLKYRSPITHLIKGQVFGFCGFRPARVVKFGPVRGSKMDKAEKWIARAEKAGRAAAALKAK